MKRVNSLLTFFVPSLIKSNNPNKKPPFNFLSPTEYAEKAEDYLTSLSWALQNTDRIKNIAISGPYGSGKSSVIKTFIRRNERKFKFLNISLATFKENKLDNLHTLNENEKPASTDGKSDINDEFNSSVAHLHEEEKILRLVELSILQQLFYHEKDKKIPDSRFKKIRSLKKRNLLFLTGAMVLFSFSILNLLVEDFLLFILRKSVISENIQIVLHYVSLFISVCTVSYLVYRSIRFLRGITIKKLAIRNAEIEIDNNISKSILNHHIDEILYFFEVTNYNVVILEDLDRFEQTEIFTKLREINLLINNNKKIKRDVVFIYAIKDDIFLNKLRTKFFDFIIPIIPIINPHNSIEKFLSIIKENDFKISEGLLEDISIYIDDMRLLYNIMNEYYIFQQKLNSTLSQDKLLSMVAYKNGSSQKRILFSV